MLTGFFGRLLYEATDTMLLFGSIQKWQEFIDKHGAHSIPYEIKNWIIGALFLTIPFIYCSFSTRKDYLSEIPLRNMLNRWLVRFVPVFALDFYFHYIVHSSLGLPGASTAPVAFVFFPPISVLYIFVVNVILKTLPKPE